MTGVPQPADNSAMGESDVPAWRSGVWADRDLYAGEYDLQLYWPDIRPCWLEVVGGVVVSVPDGQPDNSGQVPAGLREALTEALSAACRFSDCIIAADAHDVDVIASSLVSWLADHDAEVRQQGRNEAAQAIADDAKDWFLTEHKTLARYVVGVARGGSDLKGPADGG